MSSLALWNRSAGIRSSAFLTAPSTLGGTDGRISEAGLASPAMTLPSTACAVLPPYGGSPVSIS